jgi:hypothetical protein
MVDPLVGNKKSLPTILPFDCLAAVTELALTLLKVPLFQVPPTFHEFPLWVCEPEKAVCADPLFEAAMLFRNVELEDWKRKPWRPLLNAVDSEMVSLPCWPLSMKPSTALRKAMLFVTTWLADGIAPDAPPPSLKPFPSPAKLGKPHLMDVVSNKVFLVETCKEEERTG